MEDTVTISLTEYGVLTGIKKDFDEKLKSELKRMNDGDRAFVLRDRDEYIRRNETLVKQVADEREKSRRICENNVKLRRDLALEKEARSTCIECVNRLRKERADALNTVDELKAEIVNLKGRLDAANHMDDIHVERLMGRGLFARIFNRRPW